MNISYYMEGGGSSNNDGGTHYHNPGDVKNYVPYMEYAPYMMRDKDWREGHLNYGDEDTSNNGRSYYSRRMYMEGKNSGADDQKSMKDLDHYIKDLGEDLVEMINKATPEEKQVLSNKLAQLSAKVMK